MKLSATFTAGFRMSRYSDSDPYLDPATGVLKNRLGITDAPTLEQAEADMVAARSYELSRTPLKGRFDCAHLQAIHKHLFGDLYEWAGELRTIDISKDGNRFAHHTRIESAAALIFEQLARENHMAGLGPDVFSDRAAYYLGELNALHPFREGNGRAQREFISHLAHAHGYYVAWENIAAADLLTASIASFHGDTSELARFIRRNLSALEQDRQPRLARKYGKVYVVQAFAHFEKCAPACWNATGFQCECSCMGQNHGSHASGDWWIVSETFAIRREGRELAAG
jgi:cell filamentation protein